MLVSVCTIARNEEEYLPHLLEDITKQDYPAEQIEVVMVDSSSTDGTRQIMERFAEENLQYHNCIVTENSGNNQASGWNQAIRSSTGDIIIRLDAHGRIPEDFVSKNVECMKSRRICYRRTKTESSGKRHTMAETFAECRKFHVRKWNRRFPERE